MYVVEAKLKTTAALIAIALAGVGCARLSGGTRQPALEQNRAAGNLGGSPSSPPPAPPPQVLSIMASSGTTAGGQLVSITGTNFSTGSSPTVALGGSACVVQSVASTRITCFTGARGSAGPVDVVVTNSDGQNGTLAGAFNYLSRAEARIDLLAGIYNVTGFADGGAGTAKLGFLFAPSTDGAGNAYFIDQSNYTIRKYDPAANTLTTVAGKSGFSALTDGSGANARLQLINEDGHASCSDSAFFYFFDSGNMRAMDFATHTVSTIYSGLTCWGSGCRCASDGTNLYFTDLTIFNNRIARLPAGAVGGAATVIAGQATAGYVNANGTSAKFANMIGMVVTGGYLYIGERNNDCVIRKVDTNAPYAVTLLAGTPGSCTLANGAPGTGSFADADSAMATDGAQLYLWDQLGTYLRSVSLASGVISTFAGDGSASYLDGGPGVGTFGRGHDGIAFGAGKLIWADSDEQVKQIRTLTVGTQTIDTRLGTRENLSPVDDAVAANVRIGTRVGQSVSDGSSLYFTDTDTLRKMTLATGATTTILSGLDHPNGLAFDGEYLYFAEGGTNLIKRVTTTGSSLATIAGSGSPGSADSSVGSSATFSTVTALATDGKSLYVADQGNCLIRKVDLAAPYAVATIAGAAGDCSHADGALGVSRLTYPDALATDGQKLYVAGYNPWISDTSIRVLDLSTNVLGTLTGSAGAGYVDGTAAASRFMGISALALDGGSLYALDTINSVLRKVDVSDGSVTSVTGSPNYRLDQDGVLATGSSFNAVGGYLVGIHVWAGSGAPYSNWSANGAMTLTITGTGIYLVSSESGVRWIH